MKHLLDMSLTARHLAYAAAAATVLAVPVAGAAQETFHYDASNVDTAAHWAGRATLANALMFSGLGQPASVSMSERDLILKHAGYVARPRMPDMAMVGAVYAAGKPKFTTTPNLNDLLTLRWDAATFDRRLDPEAMAWSLIKTTAPEFHQSFHESRDERRIGLMMLPQARIQADTLAKSLRNRDGLFATQSPEGALAVPQPRQQAAVLWAGANLILAATSQDNDYWHKAARDIVDPRSGRALADAAFAAVKALPPETPADRALAIAALGRYVIAVDDKDKRAEALRLARTHADALKDGPPGATLEDLGFAVYGLVEAGRLVAEQSYRDAAVALFRSKLLPLWDEAIGAFRDLNGDAVYTPRTLAALVAALNAMRWHGPNDATRQADRLYPQLFETVLVRAGMLLASPQPLVPKHYLEREPAAHFAHPKLAPMKDVGVPPVFAAEVQHADGAWTVTDKTFRTADAMLLANVLESPREGRADAFLAADRLAVLGR